MPYVIAGLVFVGSVALLNLLLTFGVIRRLRAHSSLIGADMTGPRQPQLGDHVGQFEVTTVGGEVLRRDDHPDSVAVFLSPGCPPCELALPRLVSHLTSTAVSRFTMAVVAGDSKSSLVMVDDLKSIIPVVIESPPDRTMQEAFKVTTFPTMLKLEGGVVVAVSNSLDETAHAITS